MILELLETVSPEWRKWALSVEHQLNKDYILQKGAKLIADSLVEYCGQELPEKGVARADYVCERFGILPTRSRRMQTPPTQGVALINKGDSLFQELQIILGKYNKRYRNVYAHEIGHFFYAVVWELLFINGEKDISESYIDRERWCWNFAVQFMCPWQMRKKWTHQYISTLRDSFDHEGQQKVMLTMGRVYALANTNRLSLRTVIYALHHLPLLSELSECMAIIDMAPNKYTGSTPALRIVYAALPEGVFLPTNRRAAKHGFLQAAHIYDNGDVHTYYEAEETILMKNRDVESGCWSADFVQCKSLCFYVPVAWSNARHLFVSWKFSPPR